ncbi:MAG TPA: ATP-binding protein [Burkholderiales bacterium]|nr:ATP-binding protein [Burkholderiales bacterium]
MKYFSIRRRLTLLMLGSIFLAWSAMLPLSFFSARNEINQLIDVQLEQSAQTITLLDLHKLRVLADSTEKTDSVNDKDGDDDRLNMQFQVWTRSGELLTHSPGSPDFAYAPKDGFSTITINTKHWRTYARHDPKGKYQIRLFESVKSRESLINRDAWHIAQFLLVVLPLPLLLVWLSIGKGLAPLRVISDMLSIRNAKNLDPVIPETVPIEAKQLLDSINHLFEGLEQSLLRERAFTSDAAHELRNPLAAIKVQAEVALVSEDSAQREQAIKQVITGVNRLSRLMHQLLMLARLDQATWSFTKPVDLGNIVIECAGGLADQALTRGISMEVKAQPESYWPGEASLLVTMIENLVDNSIKYGKENGRIRLGVISRKNLILLWVEDDGPGILPNEQERLLDRFYRSDNHPDVEGSGLGLSIVNKIVEIHGGKIRFGQGINGFGLKVEILFEHFHPVLT